MVILCLRRKTIVFQSVESFLTNIFHRLRKNEKTDDIQFVTVVDRILKILIFSKVSTNTNGYSNQSGLEISMTSAAPALGNTTRTPITSSNSTAPLSNIPATSMVAGTPTVTTGSTGQVSATGAASNFWSSISTVTATIRIADQTGQTLTTSSSTTRTSNTTASGPSTGIESVSRSTGISAYSPSVTNTTYSYLLTTLANNTQSNSTVRTSVTSAVPGGTNSNNTGWPANSTVTATAIHSTLATMLTYGTYSTLVTTPTLINYTSVTNTSTTTSSATTSTTISTTTSRTTTTSTATSTTTSTETSTTTSTATSTITLTTTSTTTSTAARRPFYCPGEVIGTYCNISSDPCTVAQPCLNAATCYPNATLPLGYECACLSGYSGGNCQHDERICKESTCW